MEKRGGPEPTPALAPGWVPSSLSSASLRGIPPAYPTSFPFAPTTRWQGTMMQNGLRPFAIPTARHEVGEPMRRASSP